MAGPTRQGELFPDAGAPDGVRVVNERCVVRTQDGHRVVIVAGIVLAQYTVGDRMSEAHAMVSLVEQGFADQNDIARALGCSVRTVRRCQRRFEAGGLPALGRSGGYPKGSRRRHASRTRLLSRLKAEGLSNRAIAQRVGVSEMAVRKALRRMSWPVRQPEQARLPIDARGANPNLSAFPTPPPGAATPPAQPAAPSLAACAAADDDPLPLSLDIDPADRRLDRLLAYLGLLHDAAPVFRSGTRIPRAGVLLALPALIDSGVLDCARHVYGSIGPAFYGLRTTIVALLLMALLRIKRPEALKEHAPEDLGRLLGLDRAPEVKTLRRKLSRLAALGRAAHFGRALAERRVAARGAMLGFLYVDGHVRVYHGQRPIPKAHVTRLRIAMPATSDYWVNDAAGEPLFVVTAEANAGLVKMLPPILDEVRRLLGERRVTIVFDRGGFSPRLFQKLITEGFDILTYRKGRVRPLAERLFQPGTATIDGHKVSYRLADQGVRLLGGKLRLRQVTRLSENGHQTPILTSRRDLAAVEVAFRMFERWRQENFFKYLRKEYALDALVDYQVEPDDPARAVPNPVWNMVDTELRAARAELAQFQALYGLVALGKRVHLDRIANELKTLHGKIAHGVHTVLKRCAALEAKRATVPKRVPVEQVVTGAVVKLATERKHLTNLLKMVAYQAEGDLVRMITPHYKRVADEGRTLIQSALASAADLEVTDTELRLSVAPLSSAHRTRAITALCEELTRANVTFPGTRLRLRYRVAPGR
jgi:transposase